VMVGKEGSSRPEVGTYAISNTGWNVMHILSDGAELLGMFLGTEGQIRITHSSSGALRGTIDFVATGVLGMEEAEVEGAVTFDAKPASAMMMNAVAVPGFLTQK
jgi:hypothetical protein